ncbi:MAG: Undecaprenyl-phosphate 4-deoxy-4-formamido-L-arabinose transferase [Steroidobacteraceae bacterium]|nr:Undecaprenyl-phosphate 4-deoxy-4-formamido-L-arabinose transferase [Steroidobacteraceae bacterium]
MVVPVYRAEQTLPELHRQLVPALEALVDDFEVIYVEDCGGDHSWALIADFAAADPRVRGIRLNRNFGQHNALLCGIRAAQYDLVVTMDDDLQHPVEEIPKLLAALTEEVDVVYGFPERERHGVLRRLASQLTKLALASAMGAETARHVSAFRLFRTQLREGFRNYRSPSVSIDVLLTWATTRFAIVRVAHRPRTAGASGYTLGALMRHAVNLMTGFSTLPLQVASFIGFAFVLVGFVTMGYVLVNYLLHGSAVPGFAFLASIVTIFSGAQLFALGIFGEYLARMHFRSMDRPAYVVREMASAGPERLGVRLEAPVRS